jgi:hypothetical protein
VIFAQFVIDIAHQVRRIFVVIVVVRISTAIIAELFIGSANNFFATFQTIFHKNHLILKYIKLSFCKRLK